MRLRQHISAVIPAFNEERSIQDVVKRTLRFVDEVLVVDDHSTDRTCELARKAGARVIQNRYERKPHLAILHGIKSANADILVTLDADGQHPPRDIPRLLEPIIEGRADYTIGRRERLPPSEKPIRKVVRDILAEELDAGSGFRAFRREFLSKSKLSDMGFCSCGSYLLLAIKNGARVTEVTYHSSPRRFGGSKIARKGKYDLHGRQASFLRKKYGRLKRTMHMIALRKTGGGNKNTLQIPLRRDLNRIE